MLRGLKIGNYILALYKYPGIFLIFILNVNKNQFL